MRTQIPSDLTFRYGRSGEMIIGRQLAALCAVCHRLFHAIPERDIYNRDGYGLDIMTRVQSTYQEGKVNRDFEYETMVVEQFKRFTDITPINVVAYSKNHVLTVLMDAQYGDFSFTITASSDPNLSTQIKPKEIYGS